MAQRTCTIPDCDRQHIARGWCTFHYRRWQKHGSPTAGGPMRKTLLPRDISLSDRISSIGWTVAANGCHEWNGSRDTGGYGRMRHGGKAMPAHRAIWEIHNGPVPRELVMRHTCDNPPCVNLEHLLVGTKQQNAQDMLDRNRSVAYTTGRYDGVCVKGLHDVTGPNALQRRVMKDRTFFLCRECGRLRGKGKRARAKARKALALAESA